MALMTRVEGEVVAEDKEAVEVEAAVAVATIVRLSVLPIVPCLRTLDRPTAGALTAIPSPALGTAVATDLGVISGVILALLQ